MFPLSFSWLLENKSSFPSAERYFYYYFLWPADQEHLFPSQSINSTIFRPKVVPLYSCITHLDNGADNSSSGTNMRIIITEFLGGSNRIRLTSIVDDEWRRELRTKAGRIRRECHRRTITQGLQGSLRCRTPSVKALLLSLWSEEDATILQAHKREWFTKTFSGFYGKMPERRVNPTFIKDHLSQPLWCLTVLPDRYRHNLTSCCFLMMCFSVENCAAVTACKKRRWR